MYRRSQTRYTFRRHLDGTGVWVIGASIVVFALLGGAVFKSPSKRAERAGSPLTNVFDERRAWLSARNGHGMGMGTFIIRPEFAGSSTQYTWVESAAILWGS